jgi:threonine/homoserine/homoserine lactone efflux protein
MLHWVAERIMALINFLPPVFVSDEHHFVLLRTMFALLLVVLVVYIMAMLPFGSLIARIKNKLRKQPER